jgi:hypothetical protein
MTKFGHSFLYKLRTGPQGQGRWRESNKRGDSENKVRLNLGMISFTIYARALEARGLGFRERVLKTTTTQKTTTEYDRKLRQYDNTGPRGQGRLRERNKWGDSENKVRQNLGKVSFTNYARALEHNTNGTKIQCTIPLPGWLLGRAGWPGWRSLARTGC